MRSHLHADDRPEAQVPEADVQMDEMPSFRPRPGWLIFLAKHFAPRNHERYQLRGSEIPQNVWDRAFPPLTREEEARLGVLPRRAAASDGFPFHLVRQRPGWLAFLYRHGLLREPDE